MVVKNVIQNVRS